jgi:parallel beta-helix repeat protein
MIATKLFRFTIHALGLALFLYVPAVFAGTAYYVDCSAGTNGDGSYSNPWNNVTSVNNHSFIDGDDVYFKYGTTCTDAALKIDWDGASSADRSVIGCYDADGDFDCTGKTRPKIDGGETIPSFESGLINYANGSGFVTIDYIHADKSKYYGILIKNSSSSCSAEGCNIIQNCHVQRSHLSGIVLSGTTSLQYTTVQDNIVQQNSYKYKPDTGIVAIWSGAQNNLIRRNTVYHNYEGIGLYRNADNNIVEYNEVYDNRSYNIYVENSENNIVRYNLVYETNQPVTDPVYGQDDRDSCIVTDNEDAASNCHYDNNQFYGNLLAGCKWGIEILSQRGKGQDNCEPSSIKIYNNTIVDSNDNFRFWDEDGTPTSWQVFIRNNISASYNALSNNINNDNCSFDGIEWDNNLWSQNLSGNCVANSASNTGNIENGTIALFKTSGWRAMTPGGVVGSEFRPTSISDAIDAGTSIFGYNYRIQYCNFTTNPIRVIIKSYIAPTIGAMVQAGTSGFDVMIDTLRTSE